VAGSSFADSLLVLKFVARIQPAPAGAAEGFVSEFVVEVCTPPAWELGHRRGLQTVDTDEMAVWAGSMTKEEQCWSGCGVGAREVVKSLCAVDMIVVVVVEVGSNSHLAAVALLLRVVELCPSRKKRGLGTLVHKNRR
jgi:hypothetical protein